MIKGVDCLEDEILYEFFLPEHEAEPCIWLVRVSARGYILAERRERLTWPPKFGPDGGDVAVAEAVADQLAIAARAQTLPETMGDYRSAPVDLLPGDPVTHAVLYGLVHDFVVAERALALDPQQITDFLGLPVVASAAGLHPYAIAAKRDMRMRRAIAVMHLLHNHPELDQQRPELIQAMLEEDVGTINKLLGDVGLTTAAIQADESQ